jgi:hypothetical protein
MTSRALNQQNPILVSESKHQRFLISNSRSGWLWIALAVIMIVPSLLISLGYTLGLLLNLIGQEDFYNLINTWHINWGLLLLVSNISLYPVVTLVSIALGRNSISREKQKHTWSLLRLTNINNRNIVLGKWWASLRGLSGDHLMVMTLRVGLLAYYLSVLLPAQQGLDGITAPYRIYFLVMLPIIVGQAFLDAALSASMGLASAIPDEAWGAVTTTAALILRLLLSIAIGFWIFTVFAWMETSFLDALYLASGGLALTAILLLFSLFFAQRLMEQS